MENIENDGIDLTVGSVVDSGFEMGDGIELADEYFYDGVELETEGDVEVVESVLSGTSKMLTGSSSVSMKSYLETALTADKSIKLTPEEMELVTLTEFNNHNLISQSQKIKDQLLDDKQALEETIKYYKVYNSDLLIERIRCITSHIKAVTNACEGAKREYNDILKESYSNSQKIKTAINNMSTSGKAADQSLYMLQERLRAIEVNRYEKLRDYRLMLYKNDMVLNFLTGYKTMYEKIYLGEIKDDVETYGLIRDLDLSTEGEHTVRCSCCNNTFTVSDSDLPSLNIGKASYQINILEDLKDMYDSACKQSKIHDERFTKEAYEYLKQSTENLGLTEAVAQAESMKFYSDRVHFLSKQPVLDNLQKINPVAYAKYYSNLYNQVKADVRIAFENFISSTLVIKPNEINDQTVKQLFKTIKVPTLLNLLRNRHPLLMKKLEDDVNKNSQIPNIPSVAFEHKTASSVTEYIMSMLDDNFEYPNKNMQYIAQNIKETTEEEQVRKPNNGNLFGIARLDRMSPLRLNLPEIVCPECDAHLLYYHPLVTAMRTYLVTFMSKGNILDELDTSTTVNLKPLLAPVVKSTLKSRSDIFAKVENSRRTYNPIKENAPKERSINTNAGGTTIETANVTKTAIAETAGIIESIKRELGFVSDNLATQYYRAQLAGNTLEMTNILNENHKILSERNDAHASRINSEQAQQLALKIADALKENKYDVIDNLIATNGELIERARTLDQPFAKSMLEIIDNRTKEQNQADKTPQDYLEEYGDVDLETLSYEELTSKGLYNYENALKAYNMSDRECDCLEAILVKVLDDEAMQQLPQAIQDSIHEKYEILDGIPESMLADGMVY